MRVVTEMQSVVHSAALTAGRTPQDERFQRTSLRADLRARQDELDAAVLRAGDLEREVADLKVR